MGLMMCRFEVQRIRIKILPPEEDSRFCLRYWRRCCTESAVAPFPFLSSSETKSVPSLLEKPAKKTIQQNKTRTFIPSLLVFSVSISQFGNFFVVVIICQPQPKKMSVFTIYIFVPRIHAQNNKSHISICGPNSKRAGTITTYPQKGQFSII